MTDLKHINAAINTYVKPIDYTLAVKMVKKGDEITIDTDTSIIDLHVSEEELAKRKQDWKKPEPNYTSGALAKYATLVGSAAQGAITSANP